MSNESQKNNDSQLFISFIIKNIAQNNKGCLAAFRRADNPATEYQCFEYLARFQIDLTKEYERLPYATIGAAIAKAKVKENGREGIGQALAKCYEDGNMSDQAKAKLRRLLACDSIEEVCRILRPLLSLIYAKNILLDYAQLLNELRKFSMDNQSVKKKWAQTFYNTNFEEEEYQ